MTVDPKFRVASYWPFAWLLLPLAGQLAATVLLYVLGGTPSEPVGRQLAEPSMQALFAGGVAVVYYAAGSAYLQQTSIRVVRRPLINVAGFAVLAVVAMSVTARMVWHRQSVTFGLFAVQPVGLRPLPMTSVLGIVVSAGVLGTWMTTTLRRPRVPDGAVAFGLGIGYALAAATVWRGASLLSGPSGVFDWRDDVLPSRYWASSWGAAAEVWRDLAFMNDILGLAAVGLVNILLWLGLLGAWGAWLERDLFRRS